MIVGENNSLQGSFSRSQVYHLHHNLLYQHTRTYLDLVFRHFHLGRASLTLGISLFVLLLSSSSSVLDSMHVFTHHLDSLLLSTQSVAELQATDRDVRTFETT